MAAARERYEDAKAKVARCRRAVSRALLAGADDADVFVASEELRQANRERAAAWDEFRAVFRP